MRPEGYGLIDRARPAGFTFDGAPVEAFAGDTVASALLASGRRLVARSFKYHRPRGLVSAGAEEPNALVTIDGMPNLRATVEEVRDGLAVTSQNAWPSLRLDAMAVNDALAPLLAAGFYYKTFMWPRSFWERVYEPAIRRAAGLGRLPAAPDTTRREKAFAHCDLLVIGSGPAGLMAALTAARAGADVILAEQDATAGGRLQDEDEQVDGQPARDWAARVLAELAALEHVRVMTRTAVTGAYDGGVFGALERSGGRSAEIPAETFWRITARRAILCAGALERPIAFRDNDRPGIMLASGLRTYLHRYGAAPDGPIAVFANNDDAHRTARDLQQAGAPIAAVLDARAEAPRIADAPVVTRARVTATRGRHGLRGATVTGDGGERRIDCRTLAVSGGWNPTLHLTCHLGGRPEWDAGRVAFLPREDAVPWMGVAGAARGRFSTAECLADGAAAARDALAAIGLTAPDIPLPAADQSPARIEPFWHVPGKGRAWLDLQNDVTVKDVTLSAREGMSSVEHMKRYTTQGMAPDQGKSSNVVALAVLADITGRGIPETGTTTFRPPFNPVPIGALGAGAEGQGFAPRRLAASDADARARGAPMIEAGLWFRPSYFPAPGETTWQQACNREVAMVREAVGVCDVTTLGKIDVQGPDAPAFLDLVYTGRMSSLKPGRVRYGLMLREDGHVMDDGTCARLGDHQYLITTTTAAAGQVMRHLDFVQQAFMPRAAFRIASATEQWAQFAVAGPRAPDLVAGLLGGPVMLPFMGCAAVDLAGVPGRLFRISFSGEAGYELAVPARFGPALWDVLVQRAEALGGGPYGMEALNVLRIEKGFPTHAEIDGRVTAGDLGLGAMLKPDKDCIGAAAALRPGLTDPGRAGLVGLQPVDPSEPLYAGAHLFAAGAQPVRVNSEGHVTSVGHSPTLGQALGLALLQRGQARHGEIISMVDHLRGATVACRVGPPCVLDPEGTRMRADHDLALDRTDTGPALTAIAGDTDPGLPVGHGSCRLSSAAPGLATLIAPYPGHDDALARALRNAHDLPWPAPGQTASSAAAAIQWFGWRTALVTGVPADPALAAHAALSDHGDAWAVLELSGDDAAAVLARLTPLDLRAAAFPPGRTARTDLAHMAGALTHRPGGGYVIRVPRSMAKTAIHEITRAMTSVAARRACPA